jgi:hypothetical protein
LEVRGCRNPAVSESISNERNAGGERDCRICAELVGYRM